MRTFPPAIPDPRTTLPLSLSRFDPGAVALVLIWGLNFAVVKESLEAFEPLAFNALRFLLASLLLLGLLARRPGPIPLPSRADFPRVAGLAFVGNIFYQVLFIFGVRTTTTGNASVLLATAPLWTAILAARAGEEPLPVHTRIAIGAALCGSVLVVAGGEGVGFPSGRWNPGDLMMIGAAIAWSLYTVGSRPLVALHGPLAVTAWTLWGGTAGMILIALPSLGRLRPELVGPGGWGGLAYAGFLAVGVSYALWNRSVERLGSARTALFVNLVPVVSLVFGWTFLDERPAGLQLAGMALVLVSLAVAGTPGGRGGRGRLPPASSPVVSVPRDAAPEDPGSAHP